MTNKQAAKPCVPCHRTMHYPKIVFIKKAGTYGPSSHVIALCTMELFIIITVHGTNIMELLGQKQPAMLPFCVISHPTIYPSTSARGCYISGTTICHFHRHCRYINRGYPELTRAGAALSQPFFFEPIRLSPKGSAPSQVHRLNIRKIEAEGQSHHELESSWVYFYCNQPTGIT